MTRGVFWEALESGRTIDFHVGTLRDFVEDIDANGGKIVKEIQPLARNYNKIYWVQYPGEDSPRLAINGIGGNDRLDHLVRHVNLSRLNGMTNDVPVQYLW